ncbi:hypothetical protein MYXA107069_23860 [Myxococcus xanthus]
MDSVSEAMWCTVSSIRCSVSASRSRLARTMGPCSRENGRTASSNASRSASASRSPPWERRSTTGTWMRTSAENRWRTRPSSTRYVARSISCRRMTSLTLRSRTGTSSAPEMRTARGMLRDGFPGSSCSIRQTRSCTTDSGSSPARSMRNITSDAALPSRGPAAWSIASMRAEMPATVGASNSALSGSCTENVSRRRVSICAAISELPPSSRKSSSGPTSTAPRRSRQISMTRCWISPTVTGSDAPGVARGSTELVPASAAPATGPEAAGNTSGAPDDSRRQDFSSNGYVGNDTRRRGSAPWNFSQATSTPAAQRSPRDCNSPRASLSVGRRRSEGATTNCRSLRARPRASDVRSVPGPTSSRTLHPSPKSVSRPAAKRTGCRICRAQYVGSVASSGRIHVPVRLDTYGSVGAWRRSEDTARARSTISGSTALEWKAWADGNRTMPTPRLDSVACNASMACTGPETTHRPSPLTAASERPSPSNGRTSASSNPTASIAPTGIRAMSAPRTTASRRPSSGDSTPATQAAAYSPKLWPSTACGRTPQDIQSRASACSTTKSAGSATRGSASFWAATASCPCAGNRSARTSAASESSSRASAASTSFRKPGSTACSSRPMPTACAPWPGNRKATRRFRPASTAAGLRSRSASSAPSAATTARRCSNERRPTFRVKATSSSASPGADSTCVASSRAITSRAEGVRADNVTTCNGRWPRAFSASGGDSSSTTWALVPPMPKELTPARRGPFSRGHALSAVLTKNGLRSKSISGLARSKWRLAGSSPC